MDALSRLLGRVGGGRVGLFVDGPNVLREEFSVDLADVREAAGPTGIGIARLYVDEHATPGLIRAAETKGFEVVTTSGDVDVRLAVDAVRAIEEGRIGGLALASRDADFKPVLESAARRGLRTLVIAPGERGRSDALVAAADESILLDARQV